MALTVHASRDASLHQADQNTLTTLGSRGQRQEGRAAVVGGAALGRREPERFHPTARRISCFKLGRIECEDLMATLSEQTCEVARI